MNEDELIRQQMMEEATDDSIIQYQQGVNEVQEQEQQQEQEQFEETQNNLNEDGTPKSTNETLEPEEYGLKENIIEGGKAIQAGLQDAWNNTIDLGKFFDPEFYKERNPDTDPYIFASDWKFNDQPMLKTKWGGVLRSATDILVGFVGLGKIGWAARAVTGIKAGKAAIGAAGLGQKIAGGAAKGALVDAWDSDSHNSNISETLIELKPEWFSGLKPIATTKDMSAAQRTALNMLEGLGIGGVFDLAMEGVGAAKRGLSQKMAKDNKAVADAAKKKGAAAPPNKINEALQKSEDTEYMEKTVKISQSAEAKYTADQFKSIKRNGYVPEDVTIDEWKEMWQTPNREQIEKLTLAKYGDLDPKNIKKVEEQIRPKWVELEPYEQNQFMKKRAADTDVDWGDERDFTRFQKKQAQQALEIGSDQLASDLEIGAPRMNPYYAKGAEAFENQPLSGTSKPMKAVRDQIDIRNNWENRRATNRAPLSEAAIARMAESGTDFDTIDKIANDLVENPDFRELYSGTAKADLQEDFIDAAADLKEFMADGPNSRLGDYSEEALTNFINSLRGTKRTQIEGITVLNHRQTVTLDVMVGQLAGEIRDLAKASLSVADQIDTKVAGGMMDSMMNRYKALTRLRAKTSALSSFNLRRFKAPNSPVDTKAIEIAASNEAAARVDTLIEVIRRDDDGKLFEAFQYFSAASNGKPVTFRDMEAFFAKRLKGYSDQTEYHKNVLFQEMATMGINSMLSGPKTAARAGIGTGINTFMRPASSLVGAFAQGNSTQMRASLASMGAMVEGVGEAWRKAVADWNTYMTKDGGFRGFAATKAEKEFRAMEAFYQSQGSAGEKAFMNMASMMHGLNKSPFLNYGPRIMSSMDAFFGQLMARARGREKAVLEVYDRMKGSMGSIGDVEMKTAIRESEEKFMKDIWTADGQLNDAYANYSWNEAALKGELSGGMANIQAGLEKMPFIKPFVGLFMKTGVNALQLTAKYTPILNRALQESRDILTKEIGDPALLKYGIKDQADLDTARAVLRGREAIGFGAVTAASSLYLAGNLTGNGPPDPKLRKAWEQSGAWQARSIRIGDQWVSYESLEPFNAFLSFVADVGDAQAQMGEEFVGDQFARMAHLLSANVTNKTFLSGLMNLQDLVSGKGQRSGAVAANLFNNQIPLSSLRNEIGKAFNPGMRELENGFIESIRNRNLYADLLVAPDGQLPYRYDILSGKPLRDWEPWTRLINGVLPFNINATGTQTRDLLFRSGLNLEQTFNTGPKGQSLEGHPDLKSRYQYLMSQQNVEDQLTKLFQNPQIMQSIMDMEAAHTAGRTFNPTDFLHNVEIKKVFRQAKLNAWKQLSVEDQRIEALTQQEVLKGLEQRARKGGNTDRANKIDSLEQILELRK